jgi:predicted signal transduction protein with EAL and GGDEF domain
LLKRADTAMYAGKQAGKGCARRWTAAINVTPASNA